MFPEAKPRGTWRVEGQQNSLFYVGPVVKCVVIPPNSFSCTCVEYPEQGVEVCFAKFLEALVQILLFAKVSRRSHGIVGGCGG